MFFVSNIILNLKVGPIIILSFELKCGSCGTTFPAASKKEEEEKDFD
jgi:hypothetical protein